MQRAGADPVPPGKGPDSGRPVVGPGGEPQKPKKQKEPKEPKKPKKDEKG